MTADEGAEAQPLVRGRTAAADPGVHDHEPGDAIRLLDGDPQADRPAPVLDDDRQVAEVELLDEPPDRVRMPVEGVVLHAERLVGAAEAEVVGRDRAGGRRQLRDELAIQVRPRGLAVEEKHRRARALRRGSGAGGRPARRSSARTDNRGGRQSARPASGRRPSGDRTRPSGTVWHTPPDGSAAARSGRPAIRRPRRPEPGGELEETVVRDEWGKETVVREDPAPVDEPAWSRSTRKRPCASRR